MTATCPNCNRPLDLTSHVSGDVMLCQCGHHIRVQFQPNSGVSLTDTTPRRPMGQAKPPTE